MFQSFARDDVNMLWDVSIILVLPLPNMGCMIVGAMFDSLWHSCSYSMVYKGHVRVTVLPVNFNIHALLSAPYASAAFEIPSKSCSSVNVSLPL